MRGADSWAGGPLGSVEGAVCSQSCALTLLGSSLGVWLRYVLLCCGSSASMTGPAPEQVAWVGRQHPVPALEAALSFELTFLSQPC